MRKLALGIAMSTALVVGCSLLVDVTDLSGGELAAPSDAATEKSAVADAKLDAPEASTVDAADAATDGAAGDADAGPPCVMPPSLLVGTNDLTSTLPDGLAIGYYDTYGYVAVKSGVARCAYVYASTLPTAGNLAAAVYANVVASTTPGSLLARARFTQVVVGWNAAPLDKSVTVASGDTLWLGITTESEGGAVPTLQGCSTPLSDRVGGSAALVPYDPFNQIATFPSYCSAALYLAP